MTQTLDLNKMKLTEINSAHLYTVNGGEIAGIWDALLSLAVNVAWEHRKDIADGLAAFAEGAKNGSQTSGGIFYK